MMEGFGKTSIVIGSAPHCDLVLPGEGVAPEHARLIHQGDGQLLFTNLEQGVTLVAGRQMAPGEHAFFDFHTPFQLGSVELPHDHPAIALMLMAPGELSAKPGCIIVGRAASQATLVVKHPSVSNLHASIAIDEQTITDHRSASGTYLAGERIAPDVATVLPGDGTLYLGAVPITASLLGELGRVVTAGAGKPPTRALPAVPAVEPAPAPAPMRRHKTVFGQLDFGEVGGGVRTIGRTSNNDIVVKHPQVSASHAQVEHAAGKLYVTDQGSANGTFVRGQRIAPGEKVEIASGEKIYLGPMPLQLDVSATGAVEVFHEAFAQERWAGRPLYEIEAWSLFLEVPDRDDKSRMKVLLDNVSFKALPGDMIALMGPSGAGKTTLLMALNGYLPPTAGLVRINGEDLYNIYDTLRGSIGYVPQDDLVHPELTVFEAVRYSAKFRLPPDFTDAEIDQRVEQTLRDLGLEQVAHLQIGAPEKKILSGGQRKRVNIALELVTDPVILYLDEPTSGLAADDAAALINLLHDLTAATGKTIIMTIHQPAKDEFEKFNNALILGYGGVPMYYGPTSPDAYQFFGAWQQRAVDAGHLPGPAKEIDNPRDMFGVITAREAPIFAELQAQDPTAQRGAARQQAAMQWRREFFADDNPIYVKMYSGRRSVGTAEGQRGIPESRPKTKGQFRLLLSRYFKTKVRDVTGTAIMFAQAPIIGVLLGLIFGWHEEGVPGWCLGALQEIGERAGAQAQGGQLSADSLARTSDQTVAVFFLVASAIWFGTSNAAREIVRERAIYLRERMVNLGVVNYLASKFVLLGLFSIVQCTMLLAIVFPWLGFSGGVEAFLLELAALCSTALMAVALGLMLSTVVATSEAAMALTPIALIPQLVLGGLMVPATCIPELSFLMYVIPARWGFEAAIVPERLAIRKDPAWLIDLGTKQTSAGHFIQDGKFDCAVAQMASDDLYGAWGFAHYESIWIPHVVLLAGTCALLVGLGVLLKRRDPV